MTLPSRSVARPASDEMLLRVPVLARTRPRPAGGPWSIRSVSDPVNPATGSPVTSAAAPGGRRRRPAAAPTTSSEGSIRLSRDSPLPSCRTLAPSPDAGRAAAAGVRRRARPRSSPRRRWRAPTWRSSTSAASLSLTSSRRWTISPSGALSTAATGGARGAPARRLGVPRTRDPGRAERLGERAGRLGRRVGDPAQPDALAALVDPQRRGRADLAGGDVVGLPGVVDRGAGEERVVVGQPDPAHAVGRAAPPRSARPGRARSARAG